MAKQRNDRGLDPQITVKRRTTEYRWPPSEHSQDGGITRPLGNREQPGRGNRSAQHHADDADPTRNKSREHDYKNL